MDQNNSRPPRRKRYSGTHPKAFQEKYKELNPDQYAADVEKIKLQGKTPAGMHRSICVQEILEILNIQPGEKGLDATLGYGGHTTEMLKRVLPNGKVFAIDVDPIEMPKTRERLNTMGFGNDVLQIEQLNFSEIDLLAAEFGPFDFVLADLGVSSMQIDNPDRGFSFKVDGPLDLRLNPNAGISVADLLRGLSEEELSEILFQNADEPYHEVIAETINSKKKTGDFIQTTFQFKAAIQEALDFLPPNEQKDEIKKACQRCFQALRIEVNGEFEALENFLDKLPDALAPGGRVAILSFHSGEDRRVKKAFKYFHQQGLYSEIADELIRPSVEECASNPRAKSAKLRWAKKVMD